MSDLGTILLIVALLLISPLTAYIKAQTYRNVHGKATIGRDIKNLMARLRGWRARRRDKKKLKENQITKWQRKTD